MRHKKTLTENLCRLFLLALISVGVFSLFTGCALRPNEDNAESPDLPSTVFTSPAEPDGMIEQIQPIEMPDEPSRMLRTDALEWVRIYENKYGAGTASKKLMTSAEITGYNTQIQRSCPTVADMANVQETMFGADVREMILRYTMPYGNHYDINGQYITAETKNQILANRNLDTIGETVAVRRAVITSRCDLKSVPTELGMYDYGDTHYSRIQETELIVSSPVWILHESADGKYLFVQSYAYAGWIPADAAAFCTDEEYALFSSPDHFVTIIQPHISVNGVRLDMGTILPYISENTSVYNISLPTRTDDGSLTFHDAMIDKNDAVFGYLPYTMENFYNQSFAFLGTDYGWGGADGGVDCSGFICAVFRSFGIYLPRNTGEQSKYSGAERSLEGLTADDMAQVLDKLTSPASLHRKGHVMLYLGKKEGAHYVIHAPKGGEKVSVMRLGLPGSLLSAIEIKPKPTE